MLREVEHHGEEGHFRVGDGRNGVDRAWEGVGSVEASTTIS